MKEISGIILLYKRAGITSATAIAEVKRKLELRKIGHAGTLDPMATGLLVCLVNNATKSASLFQQGEKTYSGTFKLGIQTSTDDCEGDVIKRVETIPPEEEVQKASKQFVGKISQIPPQISAIFVNGKRAYELARKGEAVELKPREVTVKEFKIWPLPQNEYGFRAVCSSGTYVRSLARDIGNELGCGACLTSLCREGSDPFTLSEASTIQELTIEDIFLIEGHHCHQESCSCHH